MFTQAFAERLAQSRPILGHPKLGRMKRGQTGEAFREGRRADGQAGRRAGREVLYAEQTWTDTGSLVLRNCGFIVPCFFFFFGVSLRTFSPLGYTGGVGWQWDKQGLWACLSFHLSLTCPVLLHCPPSFHLVFFLKRSEGESELMAWSD